MDVKNQSNIKQSMVSPSLLIFYQRGISLVEIMVALVLSLVLLAGVGQIYIGSKQTYRVQDGQSKLQENARYALEVLSRDIRLAGYFGCRSLAMTKFSIIANAPLVAPNPSPAAGTPIDVPNNVILAPIISGGENTQGVWNRNVTAAGLWPDPANSLLSPALSADLAGSIVKGTDAITVQFAESCNGVTTTAMSTVDPATGNLVVGNTCGNLSAGTPLVIANCDNTIVFRAATDAAHNTSAGNPTDSFNYIFLPGSEIMLFRSYAYYIRLNPANEPALYRFDNSKPPGAGNNPAELVEGVEDMKIFYGVDADNDGAPNQFLSATGVGNNWAQVASVQITLTVRSVGESADNLSSTPVSRSYNGNNNHVDHRLVRTFTTTISLRNRQQ